MAHTRQSRPNHGPCSASHRAQPRTYLSERVYRVVLKRSISAQIRQLILDHYWDTESVDRFVRELTCAKYLYKRFLYDKDLDQTPDAREHAVLRVAPLPAGEERNFFIDNLLVQIHFIIEMIRRTGLAPWEFEASETKSSLSNPLLCAAGRRIPASPCTDPRAQKEDLDPL